MEKALPYKIVNRSGQNRYGVVVSSLQELIKKAHEKFGTTPGMKIVLESDGTEVDEEEYFSTLEQSTCLMILKEDEDWIPPSQYNYFKKYDKDEVDSTNNPNGPIPAKRRKHHTVGSTSFKEIRYSRYFIDKTLLLKELFKSDSKAHLLTTPPRFGKTINLDMVQCFAEREVGEDGIPLPIPDVKNTAFEGTNISYDEETMQHFGKYFVIQLSLVGCPRNYEEAFDNFCDAVRLAASHFNYLSEQKEYCKMIDEDIKMSKSDLEKSILKLVTLLRKHHGKESRFILLVDEYDAPVTNSLLSVTNSAELKDITTLRDTILGNVIKRKEGNEYLELAILTGVADVTCGVASPLNSIERHQFLHDEVYSPFYGITDLEFKVLTEKLDASFITDMKAWFNGYCLNNRFFYNTWSVIQSLISGHVVKAWTRTGVICNFKFLIGNDLFENMIKMLLTTDGYTYSSDDLFKKIDVVDLANLAECLKMKNKLIEINIVEQFLYQNGYLTTCDSPRKLKLPNNEIMNEIKNNFYVPFFAPNYFQDMKILKECGVCFSKIISFDEHSLCDFHNQFENLCGNVHPSIPFNHQVIHSLVFCVILHTSAPWKVVSLECPVKEDYRGSKRCDIVLYYLFYLIVIEIKYKKRIDDAIKQIEDRDYLRVVENKNIVENEDGVKSFVRFGIAVSEQKKVEMKVEILDRKFNIVKSLSRL